MENKCYTHSLGSRIMGKLSKSSVVAALSTQVSCGLDQEAVILNLSNSTYYGLNAVGAAVWELLVRKPRRVADLQQAVLEAFEVDAGRCEQDILALLEQLQSAGLIEVRDQDAA